MIKELLSMMGSSTPETTAPQVEKPSMLSRAAGFGWAAIKTAYSPSHRNHLSEWNANRKYENENVRQTNQQLRANDDFLKKLDLVMNGRSTLSGGQRLNRTSFVADRQVEDIFSTTQPMFSKLKGNFGQFRLSDVKGTEIVDINRQINANFQRIATQITDVNTNLRIKNDELIQFESSVNEKLAKAANIQQSRIQAYATDLDSNLDTLESQITQLSFKIDAHDRQLDMLQHKISMGGMGGGMGFLQPGPISTGIANTANRILPHQSFGQNPLWWLAMGIVTNPAAMKVILGGLGLVLPGLIAAYFANKNNDERDRLMKEKGMSFDEADREVYKDYYHQKERRKDKIRQGAISEAKIPFTDISLEIDDIKGAGDQTLMGEDKDRIPGQIRGGAYLGGGISGDVGRTKASFLQSRVLGREKAPIYTPGETTYVHEEDFLDRMAKSKYRPPSPISQPNKVKGLSGLFGGMSLPGWLGGEEKPTTNVAEQPVKVDTVDYEVKSQTLIHIESQNDIKLISKSKIILDAPEIEFKADRLIFPEQMDLQARMQYQSESDGDYPIDPRDYEQPETKSGGPGFNLGKRFGQSQGIVGGGGTTTSSSNGFQRMDQFIKGINPAGVAAGGGGASGGPVSVGSAGSRWSGRAPRGGLPAGEITPGGPVKSLDAPFKGGAAGASRLGGVNPLLVEGIQNGAIKAFGDPSDPNTRYVVDMQGGVRPGSPRHTPGLAVDLQIYDRKEKKYIGGTNDIMKNAYGNPYTYRQYEVLAQGVYQYLYEKHGKEVADRFSHGGRFRARQGNSRYGNPSDAMHYSFDEGQSYGKITGPANQEIQDWLKKHGVEPSQGMGEDITKWKSPYNTTGAPAVAKADQPVQVTPNVPIKDRGITTHAGLTSGGPKIQSPGVGPKTTVEGNKIDPVSFAKNFGQKIEEAGLIGYVPSWGPSVGITTGSKEEWQRFGTTMLQQESGMRTAQVNPDGSLRRFRSTNPTEKSFGPGQFNKGEYGLKTWEDVNDPDKVADAIIQTVKKNKTYAYFGPIQRGGKEYRQHFGWYEKNVAPRLGETGGPTAPIHQTNAGRQSQPGVPTPQAVARKHFDNVLNDPTKQYKDDAPYKGRGGGPNPRSQLMAPPPPAPAFGMGKKFGEAVLPKPHPRGTTGMPMVKKEDLPKPKGPPKPGDLSPRASREKNPRQESRDTQTAEEKARAARGGAYAGGGISTQERADSGVRGDQGTNGDIKVPRSDTGDSNPPAPGDDGTGSYDQICFV